MTQALDQVAGPSAPTPGSTHESGFRTDIQGLRAIAVTCVLLFHLWPNRMPGGFAGVDVFFVISGFLITSHLYERPARRWRDVGAFWGRRIRRLLPASLLVLAVTAVATRLVAPETQWASSAREIMASALYVENWQLARTSVDYLAAANAPSAVQHFWSLSVEEQFYLFWPLLVAGLGLLAVRWRRSRRLVVVVGLAVVLVASFAYSVHATAVEPASAYFVTPTRIWELATGGVLALLVAGRESGIWGPGTSGRGWPGGAWRALLAWVGLLAIAVTAFTYSSATPFPGWRAALPVLGTALVIGARAGEHGGSPVRLLRWRPVQTLGDMSYSVYLWHWPLVALLPYASGGHLGRLDKAVILASTAVLAWFSTTYVENRFRRPRPGLPLHRTFVTAAAGMAIVVVLGGVQLAETAHRDAVAEQQLERAVAGDDPCFGAAAMAAPAGRCPASTHGTVVPAPAKAVSDRSEAYQRNCFVHAPFTTTRRCVFGDPNGTISVALVGNSHAGHWLPALDLIAKEQHWRLTTFMADECTAGKTAVVWDAAAKQSGCLGWADRVVKATAQGDFDLVITSERNGRPAVGHSYADSYAAWLAGYRSAVGEWVDAGTNLVVLHDTATPGFTMKRQTIPDCVAEHPDDFTRCSGPRDRWVPKDPLVQAAKEARSSRVSTVDVNDYLCDDQRCPAVIGGVLVYYDASHMTQTFARTLAPYLRSPLVAAVGRARR